MSCKSSFASPKSSLSKLATKLYTSHELLHSSELHLSLMLDSLYARHCNQCNFHHFFVRDIPTIQKSHDPFTKWGTGEYMTHILYFIIQLICSLLFLCWHLRARDREITVVNLGSREIGISVTGMQSSLLYLALDFSFSLDLWSNDSWVSL